MGMAASQARYLALVARQSNCEYEGQQINQARTALANQSANLFNQMLGLNVPVPPSTQDFTKTQYSFTDGVNASTISSWQQLSEADPDYNYVVTHYYETEKYTGSMKKLSDPQVQFTGVGTNSTGEQIRDALLLMDTTLNAYETAKQARIDKELEASTLSNYANNETYTEINNWSYDSNTDTYSVGNTNNETFTFVGYNSLSNEDKDLVLAAIQRLISENAIEEAKSGDMSEVYYDTNSQNIVFAEDLNILYGGPTTNGTKTSLPAYNLTNIGNFANQYDDEIDSLQLAEDQAWNTYQEAVNSYEALSHPTYIGNCELTPLTSLDKDQAAEIKQIVTDMQKEGIDANINKCFDANGNYTGGIYSFKLNGIVYYTTYEDLENSYLSGTGNNQIDGQIKLAYYNATYVPTKIEKTEKALLETDGNGRFTSVRFEDDTVTYTLNMETVTDEAAYEDAMNQYYYENAKYDKMVQDINAKTSIIHQEDQQLELRLKQLDTERNALSTEVEAVQKVIEDNVKNTFNTFGG